MKLHLPTMLRRALLACFAAVSSVTFATGSAWADTYDLLVSDVGWTTNKCTITPGAEGTISGGGWGGPRTATYTQDGRYSYLVDAENTFRFTLGYVSSNIPDGSAESNSIPNDDGVLTFAFVGVNENTTILLGTEKYGSTTISYGTVTDTTRSYYLYSSDSDTDPTDPAPEGMTAFSKDGVNVTRAENMQYTLSGTVSLNAEGKYVLELSLEDTEQTYTAASSVVLGDSFDFNKFILSSNGDTFTLNQFDITGTRVDHFFTATISGQTQAADAAWSSATDPIAYDSIPMTDGSAVLGLMAGGDNAEITFEAGTHVARIEVGGNLTITGAGGLQADELRVDSGVQATIGSNMTVNTISGGIELAKAATLTLTNTDFSFYSADGFTAPSTPGSDLSFLASTTGEGTILLTEGGGIAPDMVSEFAGVLEVAAGKMLQLSPGSQKDKSSVDIEGATIRLNEDSNLWIQGHGVKIGAVDVEADSSMRIFDGNENKVATEAGVNIGSLSIAAGKTLLVQKNWEGNVLVGDLNAEGKLDMDHGGSVYFTIEAITASGNIDNAGQTTLGKAGEDSVLNIGGTIANTGTLILADGGVSFSVCDIADFQGVIDYDDSALWDYSTGALSTTGNGFATKSGTMQIFNNTGTIKVGADGDALTDLSSVKVTYRGEEYTLTADGKLDGGISDVMLGDYVIGGTGENATVALSAINAEATAGGVEWKKIILRDATTLEVDENATLSVDKLECAATAKINVNNGVTVTAGGEGSGAYSANYIANMAGTGTLLVNHDTLIGQAGSSDGIASDFAGTIQVVAGGFLTLGGSNKGYQVDLAEATIELAGGNVNYSAGSGQVKLVHVTESGNFAITEVKDVENGAGRMGTVQVGEFRVDAEKTGKIAWVNNGSTYWLGGLNVGALTGAGDFEMHHGYWSPREYAINTIGTSTQSFGDITIARAPGGYKEEGRITLNLGADEASVLNFGNFSNQDAIVNMQGVLVGQSVISGNGTFNFVGDVTVTGDVTMNSTFTQTAGKNLTVDGGALTIAAATTVDTLSVTNDGVATAHAAITINNLTLSSGGALGVDLSKFAAGATPITASTYGDALSLKLGGLTAGEYTLFQGASMLTLDKVTLLDALTGQQLSNTGRATVQASVEDGTGLVKVTVSLSGNLGDLVWETADTDNVWASGGGTNWTSAEAGADQQFYNGDTVAFNGAGEEITISGTVAPASITVNGTDYVFEGTGSIGGSGTITLAENASLTIATVNTGFTGSTTIAEGSTLTITKAKALGTYNDMTAATVLGKLSGEGTFVINMDNASDILVVKGLAGVGSMENFTGDVVIQRGKLYVGELATESSGNDTAFNVGKITICDGGELWTHFAYGTSGKTQGIKDLTADIDMQSGAVLANRDGQMKYSGDIRFNVMADGSGYDATGSVLLTQYWAKTFEYSGLLQGDGTVELSHPSSAEAKAVYRITGENNTFAGTYKLVGDTEGKTIELRLGSQTAAQYADINLASSKTKSYLMLDSDATINGLYGANSVQAQDAARTLTVTEGDYSGSVQDSTGTLSLTKQGAVNTTLILRGANTYTGATTINGGTLEIAEGATMGSTEITVNDLGALHVNAGSYTNTIKGSGQIYKMSSGEAALSGIAADFAGGIYIYEGTLNTGDSLSIAGGRTLQALVTGDESAKLTSALTLGDGMLEMDYSGLSTLADAKALNLNNGALTLAGGSTLRLTNLTQLDATQGGVIDLFTGVGSVLGSGGNALSLTDALASTYFSSFDFGDLDGSIDTATLGLQLADGKLQLVIPEQKHYLVWGEGTGTWEAGQDFTAEDQDFTTGADVKFGALPAEAESETVTISGAVAAGKVLIDGGEGKTYIFAVNDDPSSGIAAAESITVNSGTACFWEGSLDMTADTTPATTPATTLAVNDGATLLLNNGAIANAGAVAIVLNNGSTLEWNSDNTTDYSASMSVADGATVSLVNSGGASVALTAGSLNAAGETATVNLSGGNFKMVAASVYGNVVIGSGISVELMRSDDSSFAQNFSGDGGITVVNGEGIRRLSGTNTYKGATALNGRLIIEGAQALSEYTTFTGTDALCLATAAGEDSAEYTINRAFNTGAQTTYVGRNQWDFDSKGAVTGVTLNLGSSATLLGTVYVRSSNTMNVAAGATIGGTIGVEADATLTLEAALANQIQGAGTVKVAGDFTWDNTNKIYTGETQVLAGSTLTAAAPLTSGAGKVQLLEDGAMIITNSTDWANKVYGAGTLVLVNGVNNLDAIVDGAATDTLATAYVGMPVQTYGTTDVDGVLTIDDAAAAASAAKITDLVVNAGSSVNVSTTGGSLTIGQNLTLSGAGDAAATAGTAEAAALAITAASDETKISSNITLAADTTIYAGGTGDHRLNGSFNGAGYTLTKTGSGWLGLGAFASGSTNDLSGDLVIQGGTVELVGMGAADARQAIGYTSLAAGTTLRFFSGHYSFAEGMNISGNATINVGTGPGNAYVGGNVTGSGIVTLNGGSGVLTLAAANDFAGTWKLMADARTLELDHADAAKAAVLQTGDGGKIKLAAGSTTYNVVALTSTGTAGEILTDGTTTRTIAINNTTGTEAAFGAYVHGEVDVQLLGGVQKFSGTLEDGSDFEVQAGTLKIASTGQSGTHSFTATGGVLDMTGYTRAASATGADTIYAVGGQVVGLNLGAGMVLTGTSDAAAAMETITLGGSTVLGAGQMNFRVADSTNMIPGTENPYKRANTLYVVGAETGDTISLAGGGAKTLLNLSITNALTEILDPTEENAGDGYRDHTLISGLTLADTSAVASDFFATNLDGQDTGSTSYSLHFVQNAGNNALYDLVLRAMGAADTLFWNDTDGGTWEAADQTPDSWVKGQMVDGTLTPGTTTADFEQLDYVVFDDLTDGAGAAVTDVTITVAGAGVNIGNMTVQADTTNYTIGGGAISSTAGNTGATLTKTGTGTLTLTGTNSYAGNTTITGGTLIAQNDAALSNTMVDLAAGTLVLDFQNAGTDGELDAVLLMKGGNTLKAMQDATVRYATSGNLKTLLAATGKTLTLKPSNTDGTPGTSIAGQLNINNGTGMTGTIKLALENSKTYTHNSHAVVYAGKYEISGGTATRLNMQELKVAEDAEAYVKGGMTLQVTYLEGPQNKGYGKLVLEDASKLVYANASANHSKTLGNAIEAEGSVLEIGGTNAATTTLTLKQGGLTLKNLEGANADNNRVQLKGGTWVLNTGAVVWGTDATAALAVGADTTVKVNDDTMKHLRVANGGAVLTTAKASGSSALSVESILVTAGGKVQNVDLTLTGTGSKIQGSVAGVTVNQAGTVDLAGTPALTFASAPANDAQRASLGSLDILSGCVMVPNLTNPVIVRSGSVTINGANAMLDLSSANKLTKDDGTTAVDITINAGGLKGADAFTGHVIIDDKGVVRTIAMGGLRAANADVLLRHIETAKGVTTLTGFNGVKLADGSAFDLSSKLAEGEGNLLFSITNAVGDVKAATGATVSIGVNGVLGDVLDAGSVSYTIADKSIAPLASAVAWDATLALYNISATFGTDGKLTLAATDVPLSPDDIYRSSEDNVGADGTQWAGNGPNVYSSSEPYASVYIDKDTVIDLTQAAAGEGEGLVLSNLIGRGNGANLTITGDGNDLVTINNNLEVTDVDSNLRSLSFNGDIDVTGTELQLLNTVATPGAQDAGELDTDSVYQINGALTADADSPVTITSGILKLNGKGSNASELLGGVLVANGKGLLQVSGEASVGGNLDISISDSDDEDAVPDAEIVSGGKLTLLDGAAVMSGFDIQGQGEGKETLSIAKDADVMLESYSSVTHTVLELQEGSELIWKGTQAPDAAIVDLDGLTGSGAIVNIEDQGGQQNAYIFINPQGDSTFNGDLSRYEGTIQVDTDGEGTQRFDKVTTAADSKVDMTLNGKSVINVAEETGNKTLALSSLMLNRGSDTTVEMNTDSGAPAFRINSGSVMQDGAALTLSSAAGEVLGAEDDLLFMEGASSNAQLSALDGKSITLDITDNAFRRLSETAKLVVEGDKVYVDLAASETNRYEEGASDPNAKAGAELLWNVNPSKLPADSALKAIDNAVAELMQNGNRDAAERALAATAGAGTAVLGSAFSADVERQLRAIRNRTTTMGVNQCEVNEGMPYVNAWINAEGDHREMDADGLAAGYTMDSWGGTVGFDVDITNNLTMGMAVTAMYGDLEADSADRAEGDFDTQYVSLFARVAHQAWTHTFVATLGRADVTLNRTVSVPGGSYETSGDTDGMAYGFMYEVARTFSLSEDGTTCWQPVFNVTWRHSSIDAYTESGADNALAVGEQDMNVLTFGAGARLQTVMGESLYNRASIFEARAMVKVDAGDREGEADVALLEGTTAASVKSAEIGAVGVEIGAGVTIPVGLNAGSIFIDGSAEFRSGYSNVNGTVGYRINF